MYSTEYGKGWVMAMRAAVRFPNRALKSFAESAIGLLMAYAPIAAILVFAAGVPLGGVLIVGVIGVPAMAALLTVLTVWLGGDESHPGSRPYDYHPGFDPTLRYGGGYGAPGGGADYGGGFDCGGGGGDCGGGGGDGGGG